MRLLALKMTLEIFFVQGNSFIEKTLITLEDESGVLVREDAEETTKNS